MKFNAFAQNFVFNLKICFEVPFRYQLLMLFNKKRHAVEFCTRKGIRHQILSKTIILLDFCCYFSQLSNVAIATVDMAPHDFSTG